MEFSYIIRKIYIERDFNQNSGSFFLGVIVSRPKTHSKAVTVILHLKPEGLKYNLTQTIIL